MRLFECVYISAPVVWCYIHQYRWPHNSSDWISVISLYRNCCPYTCSWMVCCPTAFLYLFSSIIVSTPASYNCTWPFFLLPRCEFLWRLVCQKTNFRLVFFITWPSKIDDFSLGVWHRLLSIIPLSFKSVVAWLDNFLLSHYYSDVFRNTVIVTWQFLSEKACVCVQHDKWPIESVGRMILSQVIIDSSSVMMGKMSRFIPGQASSVSETDSKLAGD